jgi:hypothetical protein
LDYEVFTNKKDKEDVRFTFSQTNKVHTYLKGINYDEESYNYALGNGLEYTKIPRVPGKIGKIIKSLFGDEFAPSGKPGEDIESFTNALKSKLIIDFSKFKIVEGDDIVKYYNGDNYVGYATGSVLGGSCMKDSGCSEYIEFYNINKDKVKLVIMFGDSDDKIAGRALLWSLDEFEADDDTDRIFMDRIYATNDIEIDMFKAFAKKNGWLHKYGQNMSSGEYIVDTVTGEKERSQLAIKDIKDDGSYPYMDTMKYYDIDNGTLSNDNDYTDGTTYTLESTSGGYDEDEDGREYVDFYGVYFDEDELQWCSLGDEMRTHEDAVWIEFEEAYATEEWIDDNAGCEIANLHQTVMPSKKMLFNPFVGCIRLVVF